MSDTFNCIYCKKVLPVEVAKKGTLTKTTNRGKCKPCHCNYVKAHQKIKQQERYEGYYKSGLTKVKFCECGDYYISNHKCEVL